MTTFLLVSSILLWAVALCLGFLLLGTLRALGVLRWQLEQWQAITPRRLGREGLKIGKKAPNFTLPSVAGGEQALCQFAGHRVLLVFTQSGCSPCSAILPELNRLHDQGQYRVVVVNNGEPQTTRQWAAEANASVPVLVQKRFEVSKRYEVFATPFAFLIDENGIIASKGLAGSRRHLGYVLKGRATEPSTTISKQNWPERKSNRYHSPFFQRR